MVTVCRNAEATIGRTLQSIQRQVGCVNLFEHVVVDGASTDHTLDIVRKYGHARWISEPDEGIAAAFNKGLKLASGEYLLYLNADDYLADEYVLRDVVHFLGIEHLPVWVVGDVKIDSLSGEVTNPYPHGRLIPISCWSLLFRNRICHQSVFLKRRVLAEAGGFDTSFRVAMDYELWYRLCRLGYRPMYLARQISVFSLGGASSLASSTLAREHREVSARFRDTRLKRLVGTIYDLWKG